MDRTELAWAAGFWDGEGSAYLTGSIRRRKRQPQARINQSSTTGVPEVLLRFRNALGFGAIRGPDLVEGREPLYRWVASSRERVHAVLTQLAPWLGDVKSRQLSEVLNSDPRKGQFQNRRPEEQIAWAAGLWDGEGCVSQMSHRTHEGYSILEASITQSSAAGMPEVLVRFREIVGAGAIYGPYDAGPERHPVYRWKLLPTREIDRVMRLLSPQIGEVKRRQAEERLAVVNAQPALPRGNPAWGSHKVRCVNGHEYSGARIRPYRPRSEGGLQRRASKQCLVCVREGARRRRKRRNGG